MQTIYYWLFGIIIILTSCSGQGEKPPLPEITVGSETIPVVQGSYCWDKTCVDTAGAPELLQDPAVDQDPTPVEGGSSIQVSFTDHRKPTDMNVTVIHNDTQTTPSFPLTTPREPGIYYYEIMSYWEGEDRKSNGDSFYAFSIKIQE